MAPLQVNYKCKKALNKALSNQQIQPNLPRWMSKNRISPLNRYRPVYRAHQNHRASFHHHHRSYKVLKHPFQALKSLKSNLNEKQILHLLKQQCLKKK